MTCRDCAPPRALLRLACHSTCLAIVTGAVLGAVVGLLAYREPAA